MMRQPFVPAAVAAFLFAPTSFAQSATLEGRKAEPTQGRRAEPSKWIPPLSARQASALATAEDQLRC